MGHVDKINFNGNPNIGLYAFATDKLCLVGKEISKKERKIIEEVLKVPTYPIHICGTSMIGVFMAGNNNTILLPEIVFDEELKVLDKLKLNYKVISSHLTALGNNILCNDNGCLINPEFSKESEKAIKDALKIPVQITTIADLNTVGACAVLRDKFGMAHPEIAKKEINKIEKLLNVKLETGSINFGVPFIKSGLLANKNGFIIGGATTGVEIQNADEALGFIQ